MYSRFANKIKMSKNKIYTNRRREEPTANNRTLIKEMVRKKGRGKHNANYRLTIDSANCFQVNYCYCGGSENLNLVLPTYVLVLWVSCEMV